MKPAFVFLFLFVANHCLAQDSAAIRSLQQSIRTSKNDTQKVWLYNDLWKEYRDYDSAAAMQSLDKGIALSRKADFKKGESQLLLNKGSFLNLNGNNDDADAAIREALKIRKATGDLSGQGYCLRSLGNIRYDKNQYNEALKYYLSAAKKFDAAQDKKGLAGTYIWIGNVFNEGLQQFDKAVEYFSKSEALAHEINDSALLSYNYNNLGMAYYNEKDFPKSLAFYKKSEAIKNALGDVRGLASSYGNISNVYMEQKDYPTALRYNDSSLLLRKELNDKNGLASTYLNNGNIYLLMNRLEDAFNYYQQAVALGNEIGFRVPVLEGYRGISAYYEKKGNPAAALEYFKKYKTGNDSIYNSSISEQIASLEVKYQTAEKEKMIQQQRFDITRRNYLLGGSFGLLVLGGLLGYSYYRRYRLRKEKELQTEVMKQQELATRAVLEAEEAERHRIARELHDGVGQMMSAAKINLSALESDLNFKSPKHHVAYDKVKALVDESCREVRTVSHQMMPNALLKSGLGNAIRDFVNKIDNRVLKVDLYVEGLQERLDQQTETVLYRVVQECVNNVIKHSGANHLDISIVRDEEGISITIEDNGRGFDVSKNSEGIGLKNIRHRINFLRGTVEIDSKVGEGTVVAIYVADNI